MIAVFTSDKCDRCGVKEGKHYATRIGKVVCRRCARLYEPPRMTLGMFSNSSLLWNFEANKHEETGIDRLEWCGWFVRSQQEALIKLMPRISLTIFYLEFHKSEHGVKCLRCPDYPFFEKGIQECGVEECKNFIIGTPRLRLPKQRSRFTS